MADEVKTEGPVTGDDHADLDLIDAPPDPVAHMRQIIEDLVKAEAAELAGKGPGPKEERKLPAKFVEQCLYANELGDGTLYAAVNHGRFLYLKNSAAWYRWTGHYWERDVMDTAMAAVEGVVDVFLDELVTVQSKERAALKSNDKGEAAKQHRKAAAITRRVSKLRSDRGRNACLKFSHTIKSPIALRGDEFDENPWLMAVENGVVDLRTGELRKGKPGDLISKACPHKWIDIEAPAPAWEKRYLAKTFEEYPDIIPFLQRLLGYAITGLTDEHVFTVLYGQGRNGKTVLIETLLHVLGPLASPIQSEMLLDQGRSRSAAAPSPDIMALKGLRIAFASETDEDRKFSASRVKWLSGADTLVGRAPHDKLETHFRPTHALFLTTNNKPHASAFDFAFWERVLLIPFTLSFVNREPQAANERRADLKLQQALEAEASGILAWLVRGCIEWQRQGLNPPAIVKEMTLSYRREEDLIQDFIDARCYVAETACSTAANLYEAFSTWFEANVSKRGMSQKKFGRLMRLKGFEKVKRGVYEYQGIGLQV